MDGFLVQQFKQNYQTQSSPSSQVKLTASLPMLSRSFQHSLAFCTTTSTTDEASCRTGSRSARSAQGGLLLSPKARRGSSGRCGTQAREVLAAVGSTEPPTGATPQNIESRNGRWETTQKAPSIPESTTHREGELVADSLEYDSRTSNACLVSTA
jgi:hypothetical protein